LLTDAVILWVVASLENVIELPFTFTVPMPVYTCVPQQKRYAPLVELNSNTEAVLLSSCRHTSNTVTVKLHTAVFPAPSLAVQLTVVVPREKTEPDGGIHVTVTPGQLSVAVGGG
jgi:hypothetical protein